MTVSTAAVNSYYLASFKLVCKISDFRKFTRRIM